MKGIILHAKGKLTACYLWAVLSDIKEETDFDRSIKCWQLLDALKTKWLQTKAACQRSCGSCGPCAVLSGLRFSPAETCSDSCSCNSSRNHGLYPDVGFLICNTICWFVLTISLCKLEDINLLAGGWGQSSTWLKGRLLQITEDRVKVGGVVFVGLQNKHFGDTAVVAVME